MEICCTDSNLYSNRLRFSDSLNTSKTSQGHFNVSRVWNFNYMFQGATAFQGASAACCNLTVTVVASRLSHANRPVFKGKGLQKWRVTSGSWFFQMFKDAEGFNADISQWGMANAYWTVRRANFPNVALSH